MKASMRVFKNISKTDKVLPLLFGEEARQLENLQKSLRFLKSFSSVAIQ